MGKFIDLPRDRSSVTATDGKPIVFPKGNGVIDYVCGQCGLRHSIQVEIQGQHLVMTFEKREKGK